MQQRDEAYVFDLGLRASRQQRFPFLIGDPDPSGRCVPLPLDAYYEPLRLSASSM